MRVAGGDAGLAVEVRGVTGGSHGFHARYGNVLAFAARLGDTALDLGRQSAVDATLGLDADLVASAVLAPATFARAERSILAATTAPGGLASTAAELAHHAGQIRTALSMLEHADDVSAAALTAVRDGVRLVGGFLSGLGTVVGAGSVPEALDGFVGTEVPDGGAALQEWLLDHPDLLQGGVGVLGVLVDAVDIGPGGSIVIDPDVDPTTAGAMAELAALLDDPEPPVVTPVEGVPVPADQAGSLPELVDHLATVGDLSPEPDSPLNGTISIQTVHTPGGVQHVVLVPGTDDLASLPGVTDADVRDNTTNVQLIAGLTNAYAEGILEAMAQAGIGPDDEVLLVGHSQGGMAAAAIAAEGSPYNITDVVTLGAPTAHIEGGFPDGTSVLSLEEHGDVVPLLDGADNADSEQQTTVVFESPTATGLGHHELESYAQGAHAVVGAAEDHPSIAGSLDSLSGFFGIGAAQTQTFQITRPRLAGQLPT